MEQQQSILFINHTGKVSGAEKVLLHMIEGLDRHSFTPTLLCATDGTLAQIARGKGIPCETVTPLQARFTKRPDVLFKYCVSIARSVWSLRAKIKAASPDIVHCNTVRAGLVTTISTIGLKTPVIWHVHDVLPKHPITTVIRALARFSPRTYVICVSGATADAFTGGGVNQRVTVIHNGVELRRFPRRSKKESHLAEELGLSADSFLITTVGQIAPRKNLIGLIDAFEQVAKAESRAHLAIVGEAIFNEDFKYREKLIEQVNDLGLEGRVTFTGSRVDIDRVMRSSDLFVLNSWEEPFGLVLVEAMSSGTPVLATAVGGIPEIVKDGVSGYLVPSGAPTTLSARILELMASPALMESVVPRAIEDVCPQYSLERFLENLHRYYLGLQERPPAAGWRKSSRPMNGSATFANTK